MNGIGRVRRQFISGSISPGCLAQAAEKLRLKEVIIHNSQETMREMDLIRPRLVTQHSALLKNFKLPCGASRSAFLH
ncbi:hypothetical protein RRG08_018610 [Elysia crispata]|uniref:BLOC-1-related complex subunit 7 n=1 Tax=Elysia crispata TaxID=231223 RepID=A0AAE1E9D1_9GAST|nr:hypothetical protein RRG08_018610 [Elysia crispata]